MPVNLKSAREQFHKSVCEYFACARKYKNENVPVNLRSAREFLSCPWKLSEKNTREPQKCREQFQNEPPHTAREHVLPASGTAVGNYVTEKEHCGIK